MFSKRDWSFGIKNQNYIKPEGIPGVTGYDISEHFRTVDLLAYSKKNPFRLGVDYTNYRLNEALNTVSKMLSLQIVINPNTSAGGLHLEYDTILYVE